MIDRPRCASTGYICYSYREARQTLNDAKRNNHRNHIKVIPKRCYQCPDCGCYHLSSQPEHSKKR